VLLAMLLAEFAYATRLRSEIGNVLDVFKAGFSLALLGRPALGPVRWSAGYFWIAAFVETALGIALGYFEVEGTRQFELEGLRSEGFYLLVTLGLSYLIARAFGTMRLLWPMATLMTCAGLVVGTMLHLVNYELLPRWDVTDQRWYLPGLVLSLVWWIGILMRMFSALGVRKSTFQRMRVAMASIGLIGLVSWSVQPVPFWDEVYAPDEAADAEEAPLIAEEIFGEQDALLTQALAQIKPGQPGKPDLYFVSFSPYGSQHVFEREALYARKLFEDRFGARGHTIALVNHRDQLESLPLATASNLERTLAWLGKHMDADDDILFLFLNSHGARNAELSVELEDLSFKPVTAESLARMLEASGIRWKVVVISSCFSGSFIPVLKDERTLLITAARADRTSFGCSDAADFTYFGRAYFEQALHQTDSFTDAFAKAKASVAQWEARDHYDPSDPQMASSPAIEAKLQAWVTSRAGR
jgi:hypothetical protein